LGFDGAVVELKIGMEHADGAVAHEHRRVA
jgi:hypothetical protein